MYCKKCGNEVDKKAERCPQCGFNLKPKKWGFIKVRAVYAFLFLSFIICVIAGIICLITAISSISEISDSNSTVTTSEALILLLPTIIYCVLIGIGINVTKNFKSCREECRHPNALLIALCLIFNFVAGIIMIFITNEDLTKYKSLVETSPNIDLDEEKS